VFTFFALAAVTKFSSDGSILHKTSPHRATSARRATDHHYLWQTLDKGFIGYVLRNQRAESF
jgi:hypothetical protein